MGDGVWPANKRNRTAHHTHTLAVPHTPLYSHVVSIELVERLKVVVVSIHSSPDGGQQQLHTTPKHAEQVVFCGTSF